MPLAYDGPNKKIKLHFKHCTLLIVNDTAVIAENLKATITFDKSMVRHNFVSITASDCCILNSSHGLQVKQSNTKIIIRAVLYNSKTVSLA